MSDQPTANQPTKSQPTTSQPTTKDRPSKHPAYVKVAKHRADDVQLRIADLITRFAGSMSFVYIHIVLFTVWMTVIEKSPWPTLTLVVSLEAIFLSTFVMIGQNRQSAYQEAKADHDFSDNEQELKFNTDLTRTVHQLTVELHQSLLPSGSAAKAPSGAAADPPADPPTPK